jgi:hypothetical protein
MDWAEDKLIANLVISKDQWQKKTTQTDGLSVKPRFQPQCSKHQKTFFKAQLMDVLPTRTKNRSSLMPPTHTGHCLLWAVIDLSIAVGGLWGSCNPSKPAISP